MLTRQATESNKARVSFILREERLSLEEAVCVGAIDVPWAQLVCEFLEGLRAGVKLNFLMVCIEVRVSQSTRYIEWPLASHQDVYTKSTCFSH